MTEQYIGWALVVGGVLGGALVWFILGRLPRRTDDIPPAERREEATWIATVIERRGGVAPPALVDEVLELHGRYLAGPPLDVPPEPAWRQPRPDLRPNLDPPDAEAPATGAADTLYRREDDPPDERALVVEAATPVRPERARSELADEDRSTV